MTNNNELLNEYLSLKKSQVIIYDDIFYESVEDEVYREYTLSDELLIDLIEFITYNFDAKVMDSNIKNNLFHVLKYIRENKEYKTATEKSILHNVINNLITTLNISSDENSLLFYQEQYCKRLGIDLTLFNQKSFTKEFIESLKPDINLSICSDHSTISDLVELDDDKIFCEEVVPKNLVSHYFMNTINMLFKEMPYIFNDKRFLERCKFILKNNSLLLKNKPCCYELTNDDIIDRDLYPRTKKLTKRLETIK